MKNEGVLVHHISNKLVASIGLIPYGTVAVIVQIHQNRVTGIRYEISEKTVVKEEVNHHENV